jgi:hypothetical protein
VYVKFGDVALFGSPDLMSDLLSDALTEVQSIMEAREG